MDNTVSVIVTIYNREKFLRRCIDSIINQTYKDLEIILVDDGSVDSSYHIMQEYAQKDKRIQTYHQENKGTVECWKNGLSHVTSKYMTMVDSDDILPKEAIEKMMNEVFIHKVDMVIGGFVSDIDITKYKKQYIEEGLFVNSDLEKIYSRVYDRTKLGYMPISRCGKIYRTELIKETAKDDYSAVLLEDLVYITPLYFMAKSIYILDEPVYCYLDNPNSVTSTKYKVGDYKLYSNAFEHTIKTDKSNGKANVYDILGYFLYIKMKLLLFSDLSQNEKVCELKAIMEDEYLSQTINKYKKLNFEEKGLKVLLKLKMYNLIVSIKGTK